MDQLSFLDGLTGLQRRLVDISRSMAVNEKVFLNAKDVLKALAMEDWKMTESEFEFAVEDLGCHVAPRESYPPKSVGYAYRLLLEMGTPWRRRYPFFDLRGMYGDAHDDQPSGPEDVSIRLSRFTNVVMPVGKAPLLPIALLNGVSLPDGSEIPPHPLHDLWMAFEEVRQNPDVALDDLMEALPGPDFASGGVVGGVKAIRSFYEEGKGELILRGDIQSEIEGGRTRVAIVSLPQGVLIQTVIRQIRHLNQEGRLELYGIKDATEKDRIRIVLDAPRRWSTADLKELLFRETDLERRIAFRCSTADDFGWPERGALISVLKRAVACCALSWERNDDEPIEHVPLLREILEFGGYKSPLTDLADERKSRLLEIA